MPQIRRDEPEIDADGLLSNLIAGADDLFRVPNAGNSPDGDRSIPLSRGDPLAVSAEGNRLDLSGVGSPL